MAESLNLPVPPLLERRIAARAGATSLPEVLRKLCINGDTELVVLLTVYLAGEGDQAPAFSPVPLGAGYGGCEVHEREDTVYLVFELEYGSEDRSCVVIEGWRDVPQVRPCTVGELKKLGLGEEEEQREPADVEHSSY